MNKKFLQTLAATATLTVMLGEGVKAMHDEKVEVVVKLSERMIESWHQNGVHVAPGWAPRLAVLKNRYEVNSGYPVNEVQEFRVKVPKGSHVGEFTWALHWGKSKGRGTTTLCDVTDDMKMTEITPGMVIPLIGSIGNDNPKDDTCIL